MVQLAHGAKTVASKRLQLSGGCRFSTSVSISGRRLHGHGQLGVIARFLGNASLSGATSRTVPVLFG